MGYYSDVGIGITLLPNKAYKVYDHDEIEKIKFLLKSPNEDNIIFIKEMLKHHDIETKTIDAWQELLKTEHIHYVDFREDTYFLGELPHTRFVIRMYENVKLYYWNELKKARTILADVDEQLYGILVSGEELEDILEEGTPYDYDFYITKQMHY